MLKRISLLVLGTLLFMGIFFTPAFGADLEDELAGIVTYYEDYNYDLAHWEEVVGLSKAGVDFSDGIWQLPDWDADSLDGSSPANQYATTILAILATGEDPAVVNELADALVSRQNLEDGSFGEQITETIWSMIALDTAGAAYNTENAVNHLISREITDGGFALSGNTPDPDITGMVLIALAPYKDIDGVNEVIDAAISILQYMQLDNGGFASWGTENSETIALVIRSLVACGTDITTSPWIKNEKTMIDALFAFQLQDKSFSHTQGGSHNPMATRQALIAVADMANAGIIYQIGADVQPGNNNLEEATVRVRVEGSAGNLADQSFTSAGTALDALKEAVGEDNVQLDTFGMVGTILGESGQTNVAPGIDTSWMYYVIRDGGIELNAFNEGPGSYLVEDGDEIIFYIGAYDNSTWEAKTHFPIVSLNLVVPRAGDDLELTISAYKNTWGMLGDLGEEETAVIGDYIVTVGETEYQSSNGKVTIPKLVAGTLQYTVRNINEADYPDVVAYSGRIEVGNALSGGSGTDSGITVKVAVTGKDGTILYGPSSVYLSTTAPYGLTAMSALDATGLDYELSNRNDGMVVAIAGQANEGMNGWCGKVNTTSFWDVPKEIPVKKGDQIIFWYSMDANFDGPSWEDLQAGSIIQPTTNQLSDATEEIIKATLKSYQEELNELADSEKSGRSLKLLNADQKMDENAARNLKAELNNNKVEVLASVGTVEVVLGDMEVSVLVPENALTRTINLSIKELAFGQEPQQPGLKLGSSIYKFGPANTRFDKPITISIKVALTEDIDINQLSPAWYDEETQQWIPLPGLIDLKTGLMVFRVDHFTTFAVIQSQAVAEPIEATEPNRVTFTDVNEDIAWAKDAIEILAGKGIIYGTGNGLYEPQRPICRSEFVRLMVNVLDLQTAEYQNGLFHDVEASDWFASSVASAYHNQIIAGYPDKSFRPDHNISRNEIAVIMYQSKGKNDDIHSVQPEYSDLEAIPEWALNGIKYVYAQGLIKGYEEGSFQGAKPLTRAEAAVVFHKYLNFLGEQRP